MNFMYMIALVLAGSCVEDFQLNHSIEWLFGASVLHLEDKRTARYQYNNFFPLGTRIFYCNWCDIDRW